MSDIRVILSADGKRPRVYRASGNEEVDDSIGVERAVFDRAWQDAKILAKEEEYLICVRRPKAKVAWYIHLAREIARVTDYDSDDATDNDNGMKPKAFSNRPTVVLYVYDSRDLVHEVLLAEALAAENQGDTDA